VAGSWGEGTFGGKKLGSGKGGAWEKPHTPKREKNTSGGNKQMWGEKEHGLWVADRWGGGDKTPWGKKLRKSEQNPKGSIEQQSE